MRSSVLTLTSMSGLMPGIQIPQVRLIRKRLEEATRNAERRAALSEMNLRLAPPMVGVAEYIQYLDLSKNELTEIPAAEFARLTVLVTLDLSENKLTELPYECLKPLLSLRTLNVARNALTLIDPRALPSGLESLDVSFNKLPEIRVLAKLPRLRRLNAASNAIRDLPPLPTLLVLEELNLVRLLRLLLV